MSQSNKAILFVFTSAEKLLNGAVRGILFNLVPAND